MYLTYNMASSLRDRNLQVYSEFESLFIMGSWDVVPCISIEDLILRRLSTRLCIHGFTSQKNVILLLTTVENVRSDNLKFYVISGLCHNVGEICTLLGYYAT
jgi:hypothetical protein